MKFEKTAVWGSEHAVRGMRNPKESWGLSDSVFGIYGEDELSQISEEYPGLKLTDLVTRRDGKYFEVAALGENDLKLMKTLIKGGSEHRKFLRQIVVSVDITAPLYWWKEFDTYKVGTVANSTSTMHKMAAKPITLDCFEVGDINYQAIDECGTIWDMAIISNYIPFLEELRCKYLETKDKKYWKELIRWLPESWLQTRTVTMNYENIYAIRHQRKNHKQSEWSGKESGEYITTPSFIGWTEELPYVDVLFEEDKE